MLTVTFPPALWRYCTIIFWPLLLLLSGLLKTSLEIVHLFFLVDCKFLSAFGVLQIHCDLSRSGSVYLPIWDSLQSLNP